MKKLFTLVMALVCFGFAANAQRSVDLQLLNSLRNTDTIYFNNTGMYGRIMVNAFVNNGPGAILATDTIKWRSAYNGNVSLYLPGAIAAQDTIYFVDTIIVTSAPSTNPYTWCDSVWLKDNANNVVPDPNTSNNKVCKSVLFQHTAGVATIAPGNEQIRLYPNPANNNLNLEYVFGVNEEATAIVRDLMGKTVISRYLGKNLTGRQKYSLDVNALSNGIYTVEILSGNKRAMSKLVIQK